MKKLLLSLVFLLPGSIFPQSDLPVIGSLSDIKGKTRFYLQSPAQEKKYILKEINPEKNGLKLVNDPYEADFIIEYTALQNKEKVGLNANLTITSRTGQLDVYFYQDKRKVIVWSEGKTASWSTAPYLALPRKFVKEFKKL